MSMSVPPRSPREPPPSSPDGPRARFRLTASAASRVAASGIDDDLGPVKPDPAMQAGDRLRVAGEVFVVVRRVWDVADGAPVLELVVDWPER
jgi:hypothetical protein